MAKISLRFLNPKNFKNLSKKQKIIFVVVAAVLVAVIAAFVLGVFNKDIIQQSEEDQPKFYSQLTGVEVDEDVSKQPILGVMVENHPDARPQTGLDAAGIVFETTAEGGITRFLALYQENMPKEIGPIRSVRHYYLDWAMGFDASLAHVGGAADALSLIDQRSANSLSQFKYSEPYHRTSDRFAPHNMYGTTSLLRSLQKDLDHKTAEFVPFPRSDDSPAQEPQAKKLSVNFSNPTYAVEFRYQPETNSYIRYIAGTPDVDAATNKPITVKNVVVLTLTSSSINATGRGNAVLFKDGNAQKIRWVQTSYRERIQFNDAEGNEVQLNRGDLWISVIPSTGSLKY